MCLLQGWATGGESQPVEKLQPIATDRLEKKKFIFNQILVISFLFVVLINFKKNNYDHDSNQWPKYNFEFFFLFCNHLINFKAFSQRNPNHHHYPNDESSSCNINLFQLFSSFVENASKAFNTLEFK